MRRSPCPFAWLLAAVVGLTAPGAAMAQEDVPPDTVPAPTDTVPPVPSDTLGRPVPADTAGAGGRIGPPPGELQGVLADSAGDTTFAVLADPLRPAPEQIPGRVIVWDRERIRHSSATTLLELLAEIAPGTLTLRAGFFSGPGHLIDGPFGPTALDVRVNGRPLIPLIGSQPDLSQVLLAMVDEVRVVRRAAGFRVDLTTLRRTERRAYSRIEAGSGDPDLEQLRLVFTNGFGSSFSLATGFELLDSGNPASDLQGFSGAVAWMPGGGRSGIELQYVQRSFERTVADPQIGSFSRLVLGGRVALSEHIQAAAWAGEAARELDPEVAGGTAERDAAAHGGVELRGVWDRGWATLGARATDDPSLASQEIEVSGGVSPLPAITLEAGGRRGSWEDFSTSEGRIGVAVRLPIAGARVHGEVSGGVRGAPFLAADSVRADSVEFRALAGGLDVRVGPFRLSGRAELQRVNRQPAFGTGFDAPGADRPEAEVLGLEGGVDVPVIPLSWLLTDFAPVRLRGFFRHNQIQSAGTPLYVPANVLRGEVHFDDDFLEGDLGVRLALGLDRRDPWLAPPAPGSAATAPVPIAARTSWDFDLGLRILDVLIFWRYDNISGRIQQDLPGFELPVRRQIFGIRWSFSD